MPNPAFLPVRYALVTADGQLTFDTAPMREIREQLEDGAGDGESGIEHIPNHYPLCAYWFSPYERPNRRRMNTVANGVFWELSVPLNLADIDPDDDSALQAAIEDQDPELRQIKLRGPVAFFAHTDDRVLSDELEADLRDAHHRVVTRLQARGWLPTPRAEGKLRPPSPVPVPSARTGGGTDGGPITEILAAELRKRMHFRSLPADRVREYLSRVVGRWASDNGWQPEREVPAARPEDGEHDLVCRHPALPWLIVEIERGNRRATADKLARAAANGHVAIWLRWGGPEPKAVPPGVALLYLPVVRAAPSNGRRSYTLTEQAATAISVTAGQ